MLKLFFDTIAIIYTVNTFVNHKSVTKLYKKVKDFTHSVESVVNLS